MPESHQLLRIRTMVLLFCASITTTASVLVLLNPFASA